MTYLDVTLRTKIVVGLIGLAFVAYIISLVYKKKLSENFALGWIFITAVAVSSVVFHPVLKYTAVLTGIKQGAIAVSLFAFVFIFAVLIVMSIKLSALTTQNKQMAQKIGLLENRLGRYARQNDEMVQIN